MVSPPPPSLSFPVGRCPTHPPLLLPADWLLRRVGVSQSEAPLSAVSLGGRKQKQAQTGARGLGAGPGRAEPSRAEPNRAEPPAVTVPPRREGARQAARRVSGAGLRRGEEWLPGPIAEVTPQGAAGGREAARAAALRVVAALGLRRGAGPQRCLRRPQPCERREGVLRGREVLSGSVWRNSVRCKRILSVR